MEKAIGHTEGMNNMENDFIIRQSAIDAVEKESQVDGAYGYMDTKSIVDLLNDLPSAQPERKKGKWISTDDGWDGEYFVCSVCGCPWTLIKGTPEDNGMNFCPSCGADMRGKE